MSDPSPGLKELSRSWYWASISEFRQADPLAVVGRLTANSDFPVLPTQRDAWLTEIPLLQEHLAGLTGTLLLEFSIPRMGRRIDAVILTGPVIFVVEFKVGENDFDRSAIDQVWDYALDLKNFHEASHSRPIVPILIATVAQSSPALKLSEDEDGVYKPVSVCPADFSTTIDLTLRTVQGERIQEEAWRTSPYRPSPTIVEAARTLYAQHSVEAIARYDAGAQNLRITSCRIEELVEEARFRNRKIICFITGVPGAGKTLVGLNIATRNRDADQPTHAVFLSGNGPLVAVLREALTRDESTRQLSGAYALRRAKSPSKSRHSFRTCIIFETMS